VGRLNEEMLMKINSDENAVLSTGILGSPTGVRAPLRFRN
jgi:hypothetical protein